MRHILVPEAAQAGAGALVQLDGEKIKHLRKVLRMEWDEPVRVLDGAGRLFLGALEKTGPGGGVRLGQLLRTESGPNLLELAIALPKNSTMDWLVEKAVECGVTTIYPIVSSRSVVKPDRQDGGKYVRRWQAIMDGAVEQSERLWRPAVHAPLLWADFLSLPPVGPSVKGFAFVSELRFQDMTDEQAMTETWNSLNSASKEAVRLVIGPEGGFSDSERDEMGRGGYHLLSLGSTVLRVETAVVVALTLAMTSRLISR